MEESKMLSIIVGDYQKDPATNQYRNVGDRVISVSRVAEDDNVLLFRKGNAEKKVSVVDHGGDFVYQIRKARINANGGADGLYRFLERESQTPGGGFLFTLVNKVFNYMN